MSDDNKSKEPKIPLKKPLSIKEIGLPKIITLIAVGIFLLVLSVPGLLDTNTGTKESPSESIGVTSTQKTTDTTNVYVENMEQKLENVLKKVDGIGDVEVMLTVKSSKEQVALKDGTNSQTSNSETDSQGGSRVESDTSKSEETVMSQSNAGETSPYVVKEICPEVEGVLVIARGGDDAKIISEINSAVQVLFDVPAHKIKVMKMI